MAVFLAYLTPIFRDSDFTIFSSALKVTQSNAKVYSNIGHHYEVGLGTFDETHAVGLGWCHLWHLAIERLSLLRGKEGICKIPTTTRTPQYEQLHFTVIFHNHL